MNWPRPAGRDERAAWPWFRLLPAATALTLLCLLAACAAGPSAPDTPSTSTGVSSNPTLITSIPATAVAESGSPSASTPMMQTAPSEATPVIQDDAAPPEAPEPTPPAEPGIRPADAQLQRPPETPAALPPTADGEEEVEWRPPPVAVPHALHPDDHYWLARPLASDQRNYDLEWYPYGNRPVRQSALPYRVHRGMDFPNSTGTPIFAASSGAVVWAGPLPSNRDGVNYYGNTVVIKHDWQWLGQDVYTLYAHTLELFVEEGDTVRQGQLIAGVGASGEVSGPHLHLEVRVGENNYSSTRNPALWLAPYEGWGTLAGRFMDNRGRLIHGASLTVTPVDIDGGFEPDIRRQRTYPLDGPNSDDIWQENFVVADLPAGEYQVVLTTAGEVFRRNVRVQPGQTNYMILQADFRWNPTATPLPTATPTPTATATPAVTETPGG